MRYRSKPVFSNKTASNRPVIKTVASSSYPKVLGMHVLDTWICYKVLLVNSFSYLFSNLKGEG